MHASMTAVTGLPNSRSQTVPMQPDSIWMGLRVLMAIKLAQGWSRFAIKLRYIEPPTQFRGPPRSLLIEPLRYFDSAS